MAVDCRSFSLAGDKDGERIKDTWRGTTADDNKVLSERLQLESRLNRSQHNTALQLSFTVPIGLNGTVLMKLER